MRRYLIIIIIVMNFAGLMSNENWYGYENCANMSEIAICVSSDNGQNWSDPLFMNACVEVAKFNAALESISLAWKHQQQRNKEDDNNEIRR